MSFFQEIFDRLEVVRYTNNYGSNIDNNTGCDSVAHIYLFHNTFAHIYL